MNVLRRLVPYALIPLAILACALASSPWLRAFPSSVMVVPLYGAALLSVLVPVIVIGIGVRSVWFTMLISLVIFVFYELLVVLREPVGFTDLYAGLVHGPSQVLTFALPLVTPRTLMVAPIALCWLTGAIAGECVARGWQTFVPYAAMLVTFGLAYAGTARAVTSAADGHRYDTLLAAGLLLTMLLLRAAQAWVAQDNSAQSTQPDSLLPMRSLTIGVLLSVLVSLGAVGVARAVTFGGNPTTPGRVPPVKKTNPYTPVSFIAGLRPSDPASKGQPVFTMMTDRATSNYVSIATVDYYDGDGWSFDRTFRPSGGIVPADPDSTVRATGPAVTQDYTIKNGPLAGSAWMPYMDRPVNVTGVSIDVDPDSGMIVPSDPLPPGTSYTVRSKVATQAFDKLPPTALPSGHSTANTQLPGGVVTTALNSLTESLSVQIKVPTGSSIAFLQAVAHDFQTNFALADNRPAPANTSVAPGSARRSPTPHPGASTNTAPTAGAAAPQRAGSTTFADVLASVRELRSATPEQYATLMCLIARAEKVPARIATGFRIPTPDDSSTLPAGDYTVTTADAHTWVEIPITGVGWVVLDPSPTRHANNNPQSSVPAQASPSPSNTPTANATITHAPNAGHAPAPPGVIQHGSSISILALILIIAAALAALLILAAVFQLARRQMRLRRRRHHGDPRRRLLGAWQESLDMLEEAGMPDLTNLTSREVSEHTGARFGGETGAQARFLGDAANTAIFSPTSWIGPAEADTAWRAHAVLTRSVHDRLGWRERFGARLRYHTPAGRRRRASYAAAIRRRARHRTGARRSH